MFTIRHSSLATRHSSLVTRHSSLVTLHSSLVTRHSSFIHRRSALPLLAFLDRLAPECLGAELVGVPRGGEAAKLRGEADRSQAAQRPGDGDAVGVARALTSTT